MKVYTKEDVIKIIEYACEYQKSTSYQEVGDIIFSDDDEKDVKILDNLCDVGNNVSEKVIKELLD